MTKRLGIIQILKLHIAAGSAGAGILVLGFLGPMLLIVKRIEDLVAVTQFGLLIVITTLLISAPFSFVFWLTYTADQPLSKSVAALIGACTAVFSFFLLFLFTGEQPKFSGDFLMTFGMLIFAGVVAGLLFRWRLFAMASRLPGKG